MSVVKVIDEATNVAFHTQIALGLAMPPIIPFKTTVTVKNAKEVEGSEELQSRLKRGLQALSDVNFITPMSFWLTDFESREQAFKLPIDPIMSLSSKNIITRRFVKKSDKGGSIKEHWSQDDYSITIAGTLGSDENHDVWYYLGEMRRLCEGGKRGIDVICPVLNSVFGIMRIVIEDYDFPFTKGEENQAFTLKAYSDNTYNLLTEEKVL